MHVLGYWIPVVPSFSSGEGEPKLKLLFMQKVEFENILLQFLSISLNSLPNDKILDLSNLKACVDNKKNVTQEKEIVLYWIENIWENAGYKSFLLFPQCSQKSSIPGM